MARIADYTIIKDGSFEPCPARTRTLNENPRRRTMRTVITGAFISSLLAVVATPDTALACNPCKPGGSASACRRWILTGNSQSKSVQVTIEGLTTETAAAGSSCAVSVAGLESGRLVAVAVVDDDGALVPGFQFSPAASTSRSIGSLAGRGQGFAGRVSRTVPSGISSSLQLTIEIEDGKSVEDVARDLQYAFVATGSAKPDGRFSGKHLEVWQLERGLLDAWPTRSYGDGGSPKKGSAQ